MRQPSVSSRLLKGLLRDHRFLLICVATLSILAGFASAALIAVLSYSLSEAGPSLSINPVTAFVVVSCIALLAQYSHVYLSTKLASNIENQIRVELARAMTGASIRHIERHTHSGLYTILTHDVSTISSFVLSFPQILSSIALLMGALFYLIAIAGGIVFLSFISVVTLGVLAYMWFARRIQHAYVSLREQQVFLMGCYSDLSAGYKEYKLNRRLKDGLMSDYIVPATQKLVALNLISGRGHAIGMAWGQATVYSLIGLVVFVYPLFGMLDSSAVLGFVLAILYAAGPVESLVYSYPMLARASVSLERIETLKEELILEEEALCVSPDISSYNNTVDVIRLEDVCFHYEPDKQDGGAIGPINLTVRRGEVVFVIGGNGSGKTTLFKLVCGLYMPDNGNLMWNGVSVASHNLDKYRASVAAVFSDYYIMEVALSSCDIKSDRAKKLMSQLGLERIFEVEGGVRVRELSSGQRRRLALYLAVLSDRQLYVFDEPCADVDPQFKKVFYAEILRDLRRQGKAVIVISHDDNYYSVADLLVTMRDGVIIDSRRSPSELLSESEVGMLRAGESPVEVRN